jgi:hypothetical protein
LLQTDKTAEGTEVKILFDSGATASLLQKPLAKYLHVKKRAKSAVFTTGNGEMKQKGRLLHVSFSPNSMPIVLLSMNFI